MAKQSQVTPRILYVEDNKDLRFPISELLKLMGYDVACAENGKLGVEKAESWHPDFILMDLRMPVMDGEEAIRVLRSKPDTKTIPVFVLSAYSDAKTRHVCHEVGADGFFAKPPDFERIDKVIKKTLKLEETKSGVNS